MGEVKHVVTCDVSTDGAVFESHPPAPENPDLPSLCRSVFCPLIYLSGRHLWALVAHCLSSNRPAHDGLTGDCADHDPAILSQVSPALRGRCTFRLACSFIYLFLLQQPNWTSIDLLCCDLYTALGTQTKHSEFGAEILRNEK